MPLYSFDSSRPRQTGGAHARTHELEGSDTVRPSVQNSGTQLNRQRTTNFGAGLEATEDSANKRITVTAMGAAAQPTILVVASNAKNVANYVTTAGKVYVCDGTADDVEFALAVAALPAAGGCIRLTEGTFTLAARVLFSSNTRLSGAGMGITTIKRLIGSSTAMLEVSSSTSFTTFEDFTVDGNSANNSSQETGEITLNGTDHTVQRVHIKDGRSLGVVVTGNRDRILNCVFVGTGASTGASNVGGVFYDSTNNIQGLLVDGCYVRNMWQGAIFGSGTGIVLTNNILLNNHLQSSPTGGGMIAFGSNANRTEVIASGNYFKEGGTGTGGFELENVDDGIITDNFINVAGDNGINVATPASVGRLLIANNIIKCHGTDGIRINADVSNFAIIGNVLYDDQGSPTQDYGIHVYAGTSNNYIITGNYVVGNVTAGILDLGTGTTKIVSGNVGYKTEAYGATSVADGGTISHGLAATPTRVTVTPTTAGEMASVTALAATTFTVALKTHAGAAGTTQTVYWDARI